MNSIAYWLVTSIISIQGNGRLCEWRQWVAIFTTSKHNKQYNNTIGLSSPYIVDITRDIRERAIV